MARLSIVCGLPGSGKSTRAAALEAQGAAVRLDPDGWMDALGLNLWEEGVRDRIEKLQWSIGRKVLIAGGDVIVEWGTWGRDERLALIADARALGARVELHLMEAPAAVLLARIAARGREDPPITCADIEGWAGLIQMPDADELTLYDMVYRGGMDQSFP